MKVAELRGSTVVTDILHQQHSPFFFLLIIKRKAEATRHMKKTCSMDEIGNQNKQEHTRKKHHTLRPRIIDYVSK